jgi:hypothetical protein
MRCLAAWLLLACALCCHASPQAFPIRVLPGADAPDAAKIADYPGAVAAIAWVMVHRFGLPAPRGRVEVHATRESFERGLVEHLKISPALARSTAQFAKSAVGDYTVLVNEPAVAGLAWPARIELLAHELTHSLQLTLADRPALARPQWLIEGHAEWMAYNVTASLGLDDLGKVRERLRGRVRELRQKEELPDIVRMITFGEWVRARKRYGYDGSYSLAFLVTDLLIERHSMAAAADFFSRFGVSEDYAANFRAAFGEGLDEFELASQRRLEELLK